MRVQRRSERRSRRKSPIPQAANALSNVATLAKALAELVPVVVRGTVAIVTLLRQLPLL